MNVIQNFFSLVLIFLVVHSQARILKISNNFGSDADYTSLAEAQPYWQDDDTLYLEGSALEYNSSVLDIQKRLVIIGPGYFLDNNGVLQANRRHAEVNWLRFKSGSEGSVVTGLKTDDIGIYVNNITITKNHVWGSIKFLGSASGTTIHGNFIRGAVTASSTYSISNITVRNNILEAVNIYDLSSGGVILNNVFYYTDATGSTTAGTRVRVSNSEVRNNIFRQNTEISSVLKVFQGNNNIITHNIFTVDSASTFSTSSTSGNTISSNQYSVFLVTVFETEILNSDIPPGAGGLYNDPKVIDKAYQLKAGSPAIGAGFGGVDIGAFGGTDPYELSGVPVPAIYELDIDPFAYNGVQLVVSLKALEHNFSVKDKKINKIEYYVDTDPGYGNAVDVAFPANVQPVLEFTIPVNVLSEGNHLLCIRIQDESGLWSMPYIRPIIKTNLVEENQNASPIVLVEYYFDSDPGFGSAINIPITAGHEVSEAFTLNTTGITLSDDHIIYFRAKNNEGRWSNEFTVDYKTAIVNTRDPLAEVNFQLGPNPASEYVNFWVAEKGHQSYNYTIRDSRGCSIRSGTLDSNAISVHDIEPGVYFMEVFDAENSSTKKLIIQ